MPAEVHAKPGAQMLPQFQHAIAHRLAVTEGSGLDAFHPDSDPGLNSFDLQRQAPVGEWLAAAFSLVSEHFDHGVIIAFELHIIKRADRWTATAIINDMQLVR